MSALLWMIFCCFILIGGMIAIGSHQKRQLAEASRNFYNCLAQVKEDPTNANVRQRTLQAGRVYSNLSRKREGVTVYDEVALMNDINAASAGAMTLRNSVARADGISVEKRLVNLARLKDKGLIGEQDYSAAKQRIINEV